MVSAEGGATVEAGAEAGATGTFESPQPTQAISIEESKIAVNPRRLPKLQRNRLNTIAVVMANPNISNLCFLISIISSSLNLLWVKAGESPRDIVLDSESS